MLITWLMVDQYAFNMLNGGSLSFRVGEWAEQWLKLVYDEYLLANRGWSSTKWIVEWHWVTIAIWEFLCGCPWPTSATLDTEQPRMVGHVFGPISVSSNHWGAITSNNRSLYFTAAIGFIAAIISLISYFSVCDEVMQPTSKNGRTFSWVIDKSPQFRQYL